MQLTPPAVPWYINAFRSVGHLHAAASLIVFAFSLIALLGSGGFTQMKLIAFGYAMLMVVGGLVGASFWYSWHFICCRLSESTYYLKRLNH